MRPGWVWGLGSAGLLLAGTLYAQQEAREAAPALATEEQAKRVLKTIVSLSFTNADLRPVLSGLAQTYGLNIVADEKVKGTVNIALKGVPLEDALRQILKLNGYTFIWEDSILKVVSLEEEFVTEVLLLNFVDPDSAMEFLKREASPDGVLKVDEVQNGILVTDKISKLEAMRKVLEKIDIPPQQVLIQARLIDITHSDQDNLGLKISSLSFDLPTRLVEGGGSGQGLLSVSSGSLDLSGPSSDLTTDTITATIAKGAETLTATLDALVRNKRVKVLASPTVTTLNNIEAKITIGEKFPITETTQTTTGTLQTTRFVDVGITLRVTPKITRSGYIQMAIHPEVSSVSSTITAGPRITTREADTTIIIRDRESVIIAGLIKEEETLTRDRIPLLGHIPLFGLLFQNRAKSYEQKELVIVITPYLMSVASPQVVGESDIQEARERLDASQFYRQAEDFEFNRSLQARDMPAEVRYQRAIGVYEGLADQFPMDLFAPEALWRAGELRWTHFKDAFWAQEDWNRLIRQYPTHPYAQAARRRIQEIQAYEARRGRRQEAAVAQQSDASGEKGPKGSKGPKASKTSKEFAPPGFR